MRNFARRSATGAFTLIEIMVVIVILGILGALVVPRFLEYPEKAKRSAVKIQIGSLKTALQLFKLDTGRYPTTGEGLGALVTDPGVKGWGANGKGYLEDNKVPLDPWGNAYIYKCPGDSGRDYDISSYGADGQPGGSGNDADIESWNLEAK